MNLYWKTKLGNLCHVLDSPFWNTRANNLLLEWDTGHANREVNRILVRGCARRTIGKVSYRSTAFNFGRLGWRICTNQFHTPRVGPESFCYEESNICDGISASLLELNNVLSRQLHSGSRCEYINYNYIRAFLEWDQSLKFLVSSALNGAVD